MHIEEEGRACARCRLSQGFHITNVNRWNLNEMEEEWWLEIEKRADVWDTCHPDDRQARSAVQCSCSARAAWTIRLCTSPLHTPRASAYSCLAVASAE